MDIAPRFVCDALAERPAAPAIAPRTLARRVADIRDVLAVLRA